MAKPCSRQEHPVPIVIYTAPHSLHEGPSLISQSHPRIQTTDLVMAQTPAGLFVPSALRKPDKARSRIDPSADIPPSPVAKLASCRRVWIQLRLLEC